MITLNLTMEEARAAADAIQILMECDPRYEPIPRPIDWEALGTANDKLTAAIDPGRPAKSFPHVS